MSHSHGQKPEYFEDNGKKIAYRVEIVGIVVNVVLAAFKLFAGIFAKSSAMVSDAVHSASDVLGAFVVMIGVGMSSKKPDREHPFGHERMECVAAMILALILVGTGIGIGYDGVLRIIEGTRGEEISTPGVLALVAAVVSIVSKEWMYWYTRAAAKRINSSAVMASAWHHRSDAFSSIGSFVGILGARLGFPVLDPVASIVICVFIIKAGYDILRDALGKMMDRACDEQTVSEMRGLVCKQEGVLRLDKLATRLFGSKIYVEVSIAANASLSLEEGHVIAERVHDAIEQSFPLVKHCVVHVNPANPVDICAGCTECMENDPDHHPGGEIAE